MLKFEVDTAAKLAEWLRAPRPAVFQARDLRPHEAAIAAADLTGCTMLGCDLTDDIAAAAARAKCLILPKAPAVVFDPYRAQVYAPRELYDQFDPADPKASYEKCLDRRIYRTVKNPEKKNAIVPVSVDELLLRRMHDASIEEALDDFLDGRKKKTVAIMGGHDVRRDAEVFAVTARLALRLTRDGFLIATGGGPGLMEAGNLGAYAAGFDDSDKALAHALDRLEELNAPKYDDKRWLTVGHQVWREMGTPAAAEKSANVGIPTWFYGHEPPNLFATHIAKYFENSAREEGLLAVAQGGVICAPGNAGTVQEIFQDACQNYYRTYDKLKSPIVLFDPSYWAPARMMFNDPTDKRKNAYELLHKLAKEKHFDDYLLVSSSPTAVCDFIKACPPKADV